MLGSMNEKERRMEPSYRTVNTIEEMNLLLADFDLDGLFEINDKVYFGCEALSRSSLVRYLKCPAQFLIEQDSTPDLVFGRAFHTRLLEPNKFDKEFVEEIKVDKRTKAGKQEYKEFLERSVGKTPVKSDDLLIIDDMLSSLTYDPDVIELWDRGTGVELAAFSMLDDIICKCKVDMFIEGDNSIVEVKTTSADSPEAFMHSFFKYNYDIQVAMYHDIVLNAIGSVGEYYVIGVQKKAPYQIYKFTVGDNVFDLGRSRYKQLLSQHKECMDGNFFPNAMPYFEELQAPQYLLNKYL